MQPTVGDMRAQQRANGQTEASAAALFSGQAVTTWAALGLTWYVRALCTSLALYFFLLYLVALHFANPTPYTPAQAAVVFGLAVANYFALVLLAGKVQGTMQQAGLQKRGLGTVLFWGVILGQGLLGWLVAVFVLLRVVATRRRLRKMAVPVVLNNT